MLKFIKRLFARTDTEKVLAQFPMKAFVSKEIITHSTDAYDSRADLKRTAGARVLRRAFEGYEGISNILWGRNVGMIYMEDGSWIEVKAEDSDGNLLHVSKLEIPQNITIKLVEVWLKSKRSLYSRISLSQS